MSEPWAGPGPLPTAPFAPPAQVVAGTPQRTADLAAGAFVCGVAAWVTCPVVLAVVALVLAHLAQRQIRESGENLSGGGLVTAARWLAWVQIALVGLFIVFGLAIFVGALVGSTN